MKITTWNVNGIRAALTKGMKEFIQESQPDILCLQEIKARPEQIEESIREIPGYFSIWNPAQRPGYSGVAVFTQKPPLQTVLGLGEERFDVEGRVIRMHWDGFVLYNIYFPNGQRGKERVDYKLEFYSSLLEECKRLHEQGERIIITGDFNTAHRDIDLANPRENEKTSGFLPEEREWIDIYLNSGFKDVYRVLYPETVKYTWWTYRVNARARNIGWRLDYFLTSDNLVVEIKDVIVHDNILGSDHCPVSLIL
ncbi:MAG: exodeoxyribonuclease III [Anaerolineaceae bacterium]